MKASQLARLRKLEQRREEEETQVHHQVRWIGWDGAVEPYPEVHGPAQIIYLPRKASTAEAWVERVRQGWPQYGEGQAEAWITAPATFGHSE